jgi:hypothetical protein
VVWGYREVGVLVVLALGAGFLLGLLTSLLASHGPADESWSLRGNGALVIPFGFGPALLAGGWTAIVGHYRSLPRWALMGAAAVLVGVVLTAASLLALVVGGAAGAGVSVVLSLLAVLWMLAAALITALLPKAGHNATGGLAPHLQAALVLPVVMFAGLYGAQLILPAGS